MEKGEHWQHISKLVRHFAFKSAAQSNCTKKLGAIIESRMICLFKMLGALLYKRRDATFNGKRLILSDVALDEIPKHSNYIKHSLTSHVQGMVLVPTSLQPACAITCRLQSEFLHFFDIYMQHQLALDTTPQPAPNA